ncbi:hypothetical protein F3Y22_tig00109926pilonHSYRG00231 [Hibiscus syriacus]|uniref:Secreted protein n=1 Tax=Hibiscus syriacus TaxID=106335 RepID=A0A6A3BXT7_HIBSY|nr:hypothetical protein F3Y22_tig00109926pilonHSYRG00231 [Hibiscus syriacus]
MARLFTPLFLLFPFLNLSSCKTLKRDVRALNEIKLSLGWRVVYAWSVTTDDPCGDGNRGRGLASPALSWVTIELSPDWKFMRCRSWGRFPFRSQISSI